MPEKEINFFATLIHEYGIVNVSLSLLLVALALCIPIVLSWLRDSMKRKDEKKFLNVFTGVSNDIKTLANDIKILANQYNDSISIAQVEIILENFLKHHSGALFDFIRDIIEKNDLRNQRASIENNIKMQIYITFKAIDNALAKFKYKTKSLNEFVDRCTWETQINDTIIKIIYNNKLTTPKKIIDMKTYLKTEFGNIHFLIMQDINKY
ncbi:MAG: hypothetical protein PHT07_15100 [Paludibacter sp.]|nr:hypothetical protein [Paludibacter sp.]